MIDKELIKQYREDAYLLLRKLYEERGLLSTQIQSYNSFIEVSVPNIVKEYSRIVPLLTPPGVERVEILLKDIKIEKPKVRELGGFFREVYPMEARLRDLTYASPMWITMEIREDGKIVEEKDIYVGSIPVMVKSKLCRLYGLGFEELVKLGEDPYDPGGYFIINGAERVIVFLEDLYPNRVLLEPPIKQEKSEKVRVFSEKGQYRVTHIIEKTPDDMIYISFGKIKKLPIMILLKALGIDKEQILFEIISEGDPRFASILYRNFYETNEIKTTEDALMYIGKLLGLRTRKRRIMRAEQFIDTILLPHLGNSIESRIDKLLFLAKAVRKLILFSFEDIKEEDRDHYAFKKVRGPGELMSILFRTAIYILVNDIRQNYEKVLKRGRKPTLLSIVRPDKFTTRMVSSLATGEWPGERKGVSQYVERSDFYTFITRAYRVKSTMSEDIEKFEARDLHATHWGRLCVAETPDSNVIGLRKNLGITAEITPYIDVRGDELIKLFEIFGLKSYKTELKELKKK